MPLRFALACTLALSSGLSANTVNDIDTQSVDWLLSQISIGEAQQNKKLVEDSLRKLVAIAPARIETQCVSISLAVLALNPELSANVQARANLNVVTCL